MLCVLWSCYWKFLYCSEAEDGEVWYYSTEAQFNEVLSRLDPQEYEPSLFQEMDILREKAGEQMLLTYELTEKHKPSGVKVTALQMDIGKLGMWHEHK